MKESKKSKDVVYNSLEELREAYGLKPIKRRTSDEEKLKAQREKFVGKCRACGELLSFIEGTNICSCKNPECKGVKMTGKNDDGTEKVWFIPVNRVLNDKGMEIGERLFSE